MFNDRYYESASVSFRERGVECKGHKHTFYTSFFSSFFYTRHNAISIRILQYTKYTCLVHCTFYKQLFIIIF